MSKYWARSSPSELWTKICLGFTASTSLMSTIGSGRTGSGIPLITAASSSSSSSSSSSEKWWFFACLKFIACLEIYSYYKNDYN